MLIRTIIIISIRSVDTAIDIREMARAMATARARARDMARTRSMARAMARMARAMTRATDKPRLACLFSPLSLHSYAYYSYSSSYYY